MTVTITNPLDGSNETLNATTTGTPITQSYAGGVLSLTAPSGFADWQTYQTVLDSITYSDSASSPNTANRTIDVVINDGTDISQVDTITVKFNDT